METYLKANLQLPCEVKGSDRFSWEDINIDTEQELEAYEKLKEENPSCSDKYELLGIEAGVRSVWQMYKGQDIGAYVRRVSDNKEFTLGLSELAATDYESENGQLLCDFDDWITDNV